MAAHSVTTPARIAALDVVRGFALIGILLMNIEFFNRPLSDLGSGVQSGQSGPDLWFSLFVMYFVVGKFWTMFSLLFGMGFGVMLERAEAAGRAFLVPYLRRIAGLALIGTVHYILIWGGDILFSYAVAALCLLVVLFARATWLLLSIVLLAVAGAVFKQNWTFTIAGCLFYFGLLGWYLRCPEQLAVGRRTLPLFKIVTRVLMLAGAGAIVASVVIPTLPHEARFMMPVVGSLLLLLSILMVRFHAPVAARPWRIAVAMYVFSAAMGIGFGAMQYYVPNPANAEPKAVAATAARVAEHKAELAKETQLLSQGTYAQVVAMRAERFVARAPGQFGFSTIIVCMFLLGLWFVRSGVMANSGAHLPLFRRMAWIGLPLGIGLGLLGGLIATHAVPGTNDGHMLATGLLRLGNLPACLGYVGVVVLLLHGGSRIRLLAPFGRMALTNYLTHSIVFTLICYGYGLGYFGIARIWQLPCVIAMVALQIPLCHWWLARFRYGPAEWVWRAVTYWKVPPMRVAAATPVMTGTPA